jgi:hypothetical protein
MSQLTLEQQIAAARRRMQELYDAHGCTDPEVLAASIEVDELMNRQYRELQKQKGISKGISYVKD